jgi:hypothetical protein
VKKSVIVFWIGFMMALSMSLILGSERYLAGELTKSAQMEAELKTGTLVLDSLSYYTLVLENPNHEDAFELGERLAAGGFAVVAAGAPFNQVVIGVAKKAENLSGLEEALKSGGWQSEIEKWDVPRTEWAYSTADVFFIQSFGPFLVQTHRWAGRLIDFVNDPWDRIQSAPEAKERLAILAEEFAACGEAAKQASESAPPEEKALIDGLRAAMDRVGQGIDALEKEGSKGRHDYLTQQAAAFLYQWKDVILSRRNLS